MDERVRVAVRVCCVLCAQSRGLKRARVVRCASGAEPATKGKGKEKPKDPSKIPFDKTPKPKLTRCAVRLELLVAGC